MSVHPHPSRFEILAESESHLHKLAPAPLPSAQRLPRPPDPGDAAATNLLAVPVVVQGADRAAVATFQPGSCNPGDAPVEGSPTRLGAPCEAARAGMPTAPPLSEAERELRADIKAGIWELEDERDWL